MRGMVTATTVAVLLSGTAWAQEPVKSAATAQERRQHVLGLDLYGGGIVTVSEEVPGEGNLGGWGWEASAAVRFDRLGVAVAVGREFVIPDVHATFLVAGPRFTGGFGMWDIRGFAHVLGGFARTGGATPTQDGFALMTGVGVDVAFVRFQVEYVRLGLDNLPNNFFRFYVGGGIPLCFRGCRKNEYGGWMDGIPVSGRTTTK